MSGAVAVQAVITGLSIGSVYALVALGFTLVYALTRVFDLAHGDIVVGAVFIAVLTVLGKSPVAGKLAAGSALAFVALALVSGVVLSLAVYVVAIRPFLPHRAGWSRRRRSDEVIGWVAGGIAAGLVIREVLGLVFTAQAYAVPDPLRLSSFTDTGVVGLPGDAVVPARVFGVLAIGIVAALVAQLALVRGRTGRALRAVTADPEAAAMLGVPVERVVCVAFAATGLLAGLAGVLYAPAGSLTLDAGVILGLKGITAALLGGLGSLRGAIGGGLVLGVIESLAVASSALGAAYVDVLPLAILVAVLAVRPEGLWRRPAELVE